MKTLEPRVGMLTNHEVLTHITAMKARYTAQHHRSGGAHAMKAENLETVMKEVREYLLLTPCAQQTDEQIKGLMNELGHRWGTEGSSSGRLEKAEVLMMINERPENVAELDCAVEEMENRFSEEEQLEIVECVKRWLPRKPKEEVKGEGEE